MGATVTTLGNDRGVCEDVETLGALVVSGDISEAVEAVVRASTRLQPALRSSGR